MTCRKWLLIREGQRRVCEVWRGEREKGNGGGGSRTQGYWEGSKWGQTGATREKDTKVA